MKVALPDSLHMPSSKRALSCVYQQELVKPWIEDRSEGWFSLGSLLKYGIWDG